MCVKIIDLDYFEETLVWEYAKIYSQWNQILLPYYRTNASEDLVRGESAALRLLRTTCNDLSEIPKAEVTQ